MATYEHNALQNYKDNDGNIHIVYPVTKSDNVDGIENYATNDELDAFYKANADAILAETTRAKLAEQANSDAITAENNRASTAETELKQSLIAEIARANNSLENFIFVNVSNCVKKYSAFYNSITKMMFISFEINYGDVATPQSITIFNDHAHTPDTNYSFPVSAWDASKGTQVLSYGYTSGKDIRIYAPPCSNFNAYGILFYHCQ